MTAPDTQPAPASGEGEAPREALARAWDDGYNDAATMAHCYGHTDHWPEDAEPANPYRAALGGEQAGDGGREGK